MCACARQRGRVCVCACMRARVVFCAGSGEFTCIHPIRGNSRVQHRPTHAQFPNTHVGSESRRRAETWLTSMQAIITGVDGTMELDKLSVLGGFVVQCVRALVCMHVFPRGGGGGGGGRKKGGGGKKKKKKK